MKNSEFKMSEILNSLDIKFSSSLINFNTKPTLNIFLEKDNNKLKLTREFEDKKGIAGYILATDDQIIEKVIEIYSNLDELEKWLSDLVE